MIPSNLIELIEKGEAQFRNWCTGGSGATRIPVPKNNYIVITDFHFQHFIDVDPLAESDKEIRAELAKNHVHNLAFRSYGSEYFYGIRSGYQAIAANLDAGLFTIPQVDSKYNCYQVHKTDCHIDIWRYTDYLQWVQAFQPLNDATTETPNPVGYGTKPNGAPYQDALVGIEFGVGGAVYLPYWLEGGLPFGATPGTVDMFRDSINNGTFLFPPDLRRPDAHFTYPILNISYVLVNHPFNKKTR